MTACSPRPMSKDGVDPYYPVSAETIGIQFAHSMGIEGTDQAALAKLRALSAVQVVGGAPAQPGGSVQSYETTPILDGKLITETAYRRLLDLLDIPRDIRKSTLLLTRFG